MEEGLWREVGREVKEGEERLCPRKYDIGQCTDELRWCPILALRGATSGEGTRLEMSLKNSRGKGVWKGV